MRRLRLALAILLSLSADPVHAGGPLPPGKPAGMRAAELMTQSGAIFVTAAVVIAVAGLAASGHLYKIPGQASPTSTTP